MELLRGNNPDWPVSRRDVYGNEYKRWLHSDIKNMALPYVFNTYDTMLKLGNYIK